MIMFLQNSMGNQVTESRWVVALGFPGMWRVSGVGRVRELERNLGGDGYVHYFSGFMSVYLSPDLPDVFLKSVWFVVCQS